MKATLIITALCLATTTAQAQKLAVTKTTIDAGKTGYEVPITATFELRNKDSKPLIIKEVKPDCGCTTVDYPTQPIGGKKKFTITMTYDARMLGHFTKQVAIYSNATEKPVYLQMKGIVLEEVQNFTNKYPYEFQGLQADVNNLEFDDVKKGDHPEAVIHIANNTENTVVPNMLHLPPYLTAIVTPEHLAPGRVGKISLTLNSEKVTNYGLTQSSVFLAKKLGEKVDSDIELPVSVVLLPDVDVYSGDMKKYAPKLHTSADSLNIGLHNGKKLKSGTIVITNNGRTALNISSLQMFTKGLKVTLDKRELQPGEQAKLKVKGDRNLLLKAKSKPRILMITNDPDHAKVVIRINVK